MNHASLIKKIQSTFLKAVFLGALSILMSCSAEKAEPGFYSAGDFEKVPKIDAHFHYLTMDDQYMKFAISENFKLLSPIYEGEVPIGFQLDVSAAIKHAYPQDYAFFATFPTQNFNAPDFAEKTIEYIRKALQRGATGIKIWKNIGMELKNRDGHYVMIDDPAFEPIFTFLEQNKIPVIGHQGEPRDCWLALDKMIDPAAVDYYKNNPQYHMFLHPEAPSYDQQMSARDNVLRKHPKLDFIGAHLASLEWSVDALAKHFDTYPNLKVDMAARMYPLQYQSNADREKVRNFIIKYQDRILYGSDIDVSDAPKRTGGIHKQWLNDWIFMTTDSTVKSGNLKLKGLKLPKEVIDNIYFKNAEKYFQKDRNAPTSALSS